MEFSFLKEKEIDDLRRLGAQQQAENAAKKAEEDAAKLLEYQEIMKEKAERLRAAEKEREKYEKKQLKLQILKEKKKLEKERKEEEARRKAQSEADKAAHLAKKQAAALSGASHDPSDKKGAKKQKKGQKNKEGHAAVQDEDVFTEFAPTEAEIAAAKKKRDEEEALEAQKKIERGPLLAKSAAARENGGKKERDGGPLLAKRESVKEGDKAAKEGDKVVVLPLPPKVKSDKQIKYDESCFSDENMRRVKEGILEEIKGDFCEYSAGPCCETILQEGDEYKMLAYAHAFVDLFLAELQKDGVNKKEILAGLHTFCEVVSRFGNIDLAVSCTEVVDPDKLETSVDFTAPISVLYGEKMLRNEIQQLFSLRNEIPREVVRDRVKYLVECASEQGLCPEVLEWGFDIDLKRRLMQNYRLTSLALVENDAELLEFLLEKGASLADVKMEPDHRDPLIGVPITLTSTALAFTSGNFMGKNPAVFLAAKKCSNKEDLAAVFDAASKFCRTEVLECLLKKDGIDFDPAVSHIMQEGYKGRFTNLISMKVLQLATERVKRECEGRDDAEARAALNNCRLTRQAIEKYKLLRGEVVANDDSAAGGECEEEKKLAASNPKGGDGRDGRTPSLSVMKTSVRPAKGSDAVRTGAL